MSAASAAQVVASARVPTAPIEALAQAVQEALGGTPLASYVAFAIVTYAAAAFLAWKAHGELKKDWTSIGEWRDRVLLIVASSASDKPDHLERYLLGQLPLFKGKVMLHWPDATMEPLIGLNRHTLRATEWGFICADLAKTLSSPLVFFTMFVIQMLLGFILITNDWPRIFSPDYLPWQQVFLCVIFAWPIAMYVLQYSLLPEWKKRVDEAVRNAEKLSIQFQFTKVRLETAP